MEKENKPFRVEDFFDVKSLTKEEVQSIAINIQDFIEETKKGKNDKTRNR